MAVGCRSLSASWLGGVSLSAVSAGGYSIYDTSNPTGSQQLLSSSYIFNPPKFTNYKSKDNSCFENLFKGDLGFDSNRVYGCRVAELNIWSSGEQFKDKQIAVDYLTFTKKLTIRKGSKGLQIIRVINSREGLIVHTKLTYYTRDANGWKEKRLELASQKLTEKSKPKTKEQRTISALLSENKYLHFEADNSVWYKGKDLANDQTNKDEELSEVWKDVKSGSWIWVEDNNPESGMIWDGLSYAFKDTQKQTKIEWDQQLVRTYFPENGMKVEYYSLISNLYQPFLKDLNSRGKWINTEKFCNYGPKRNIEQDDLKNLRMYCAKPNS